MAVPMDGVKAGVTFAGESLVPGGANFLKGDLFQGGAHLVAGLAARAALGVPGLLLVGANSISKATTGRHLVEHIGLWSRPSAPPSDPAPVGHHEETL